MPSGAKKRKAAKKKKENQPNTHPSPSSAASQSEGGEDVKQDSDAGEGNSPYSQDNRSHEDFLNEGEVERKNSSDVTPVEGVKIEVVNDAKVGSEEVNVDSVEREFKIEDVSNGKDGRFEHGGTSTSRSGSSDDESQVDEVTALVVDSAKKDDDSNNVAIEETNYSTVESIPVIVSEDIYSTSYKTTIVEDQRASGEDKVAIFTASEQKEDAIITSVEAIVVKESVRHTTEENGANPEDNSQATEHVLTSDPHPVRTTSWKGCCGLFEVFTGSGR